jgi:hypothetical protein
MAISRESRTDMPPPATMPSWACLSTNADEGDPTPYRVTASSISTAMACDIALRTSGASSRMRMTCGLG